MSITPLRNRLAAWVGACTVAVAALAPGTGQAAYVLSEFSIAGAAHTALWDVNNAGVMVGYTVDGSGASTGFIRAGDGTITALTGPAGATSTNALGISDGGTVVGSYNSGGPQRGFVYTGGSYMVFTIAGAVDTFLRGISPDGRYWSGYYSTALTQGVGFVFDSLNPTLQETSVPGSQLTIMQGINAAGIVVGSDIIGSPPTSLPGVLFDIAAGTRSEVTLAGAVRTALRSIDDSGVLAGWFRDAGGGTHGFVGSPGSYEQIDFAGATQTFVEGSNNDRWLVGSWNDAAGGSHAFIGTPVPAPGSLALALAGLGALVRFGARTRRTPG